MSQIKQLSLAEIAALDEGRLEACVDTALAKIGDDLTDRPGLKTARTLTIKVSFVPRVNENTGAAERAHVSYEVAEKIPGRKSGQIDVGLRPSGQMLFRGENAENYEQPGLFAGDDE